MEVVLKGSQVEKLICLHFLDNLTLNSLSLWLLAGLAVNQLFLRLASLIHHSRQRQLFCNLFQRSFYFLACDLRHIKNESLQINKPPLTPIEIHNHVESIYGLPFAFQVCPKVNSSLLHFFELNEPLPRTLDQLDLLPKLYPFKFFV